MSDRGVYRLASAMLLQAIQDATSSSRGRRVSAFRWMNRSDESGLSFSFVCRVVNRDPDEVRRFCLEKAMKQALPELPFRVAFRPPSANTAWLS